VGSKFGALVLAATLTSTLGAGTASAAPAPVPPRPWLRATALAGLGRVAFVWRGGVWVAGNGLGRAHALGSGTDPVWSADGRYVLFFRPRAETDSLWLAPGAGGAARELLGSVVPTTVAWVPGTDRLLAASVPSGYTTDGKPEGSAGMWAFAAVGGGRMPILLGSWVNTLAVGDGEVAYSVTLPTSHSPLGRTDALYTLSLARPLRRPRRLAVAPGGGIEVASVQAGRVQYWLDPMHSASLAADGLGLFSRPLGGGPAVGLGTTLTYRSWLAAGKGDTLYLIAGGPRIAWSDKSLRRCALASGRCESIYGGEAAVANDPAVSPSGKAVLFVASPSRGNNWGFDGKGRAVLAWQATRRLWLWRPGRPARPLPDAPRGVSMPTFTRDPHVALVVAQGGLWRVNLSTGRSREVIGGFLSRTADADIGYYGYRQDIAASFAFVPA
jgi:TolB protein